MQLKKQAWLGLAAALLLAGAAQAAVTVTYVKSDQFADVPRSVPERDRLLDQLSAHFQQLGKALPAGQDLAITVTDLDLAGRIDWSHRFTDQDIRVLHGDADWPHMRLHYSLSAAGQTLASADADLSDMTYLQRVNRYSSGEPLRYEKLMIDDWFSKQFGVKPVR